MSGGRDDNEPLAMFMTGTTAMHQTRALKTAYTRLPVLAR